MILTMLPYKFASESARDLSKALGVKRIYPDGGYYPKSGHKIINWGNSHPHFSGGNFFNKPEAVAIAANKLDSFAKLWVAGVATPELTLDPAIARAWLDRGWKVVCRQTITGHGGHGITVVKPGEQLITAKFYTKYVRKDQEYRVHVGGGKVIDFTEKRRSHSRTLGSEYIRSYDNGWVFCRENISLPEIVRKQSIAAVVALGLDFGAVDIAYRDGKAWVFEINTAPGLDGTTIERYKQYFRANR